MTADTEADCQQVLRHLGEIHPTLPLWRQQRPALHLDSVAPQFSTADASAQGNVVIRYCHAALNYLFSCCCGEKFRNLSSTVLLMQTKTGSLALCLQAKRHFRTHPGYSCVWLGHCVYCVE